MNTLTFQVRERTATEIQKMQQSGNDKSKTRNQQIENNIQQRESIRSKVRSVKDQLSWQTSDEIDQGKKREVTNKPL